MTASFGFSYVRARSIALLELTTRQTRHICSFTMAPHKRQRDDEVAAAMLAATRACLPHEESTSKDPKKPTGRRVGPLSRADG